MRKIVSGLLCGLALTTGSVALAASASAKEWKEVGTFRKLSDCQAAAKRYNASTSCELRGVNGYTFYILTAYI
ncbi:hypothetical protein FXN61_41035 [Lentzea sp. PSKA42]|uniref:DUF4189 domain-containing protein n=1 Tax=Lentzea indica TaxID=2604800 RepID=A0ABX1FUR3_9PSEU|nr:hypothetical protein [Lentzea indica]NKE62770.1 hypothetical protein [Lentzea indica]